jgi:hypothetical protein
MIALVAAIAALILSVTIAVAQDADGAQVYRLESDSSKRLTQEQAKTIWRKPEYPLTWEEQRIHDRAFGDHWLFPSIETGE